MSLFDTNLDYTKLIQFSNGTLKLASFVQIRNALIDVFKNIYGNDIDVSAASADGQYINAIALLINNIFQTLKQGNDSLDPAVATGGYLDVLCSYNNIQRIQPTNSSAQLYIYNNTNNDITPEEVPELLFIDKNNTLWKWVNPGNFGFKAKEITPIKDVLCDELGDVLAPGANTFIDSEGNESEDPEDQDWNNPDLYQQNSNYGTIYQCVDNNGLIVWQYSDAIPGEIEETDEALRSRRYQTLGNNSVTVLEGIKGNLLNLDAVKDVYIFNNLVAADGASGGTVLSGETYEPIADGASLYGRSIYVAVRYKEGIDIDSQRENVGRIIYNKLTPGILTNPFSADPSDPRNQSLDIVRTSNGFTDHIYWKRCISINPEIKLTFYLNPAIFDGTETTTAHSATSDLEINIRNKLQEYLNNVKINEYLTIPNLLTILQQADIKKGGMNTFFTKDGYFYDDSSILKVPANLNYFKYDDADYEFSYDLVNNIGTLVISGDTL